MSVIVCSEENIRRVSESAGVEMRLVRMRVLVKIPMTRSQLVVGGGIRGSAGEQIVVGCIAGVSLLDLWPKSHSPYQVSHRC